MKYVELCIETDTAGADILGAEMIALGSGGVCVVDKNDYIELEAAGTAWDLASADMLDSYPENVLVKGYYDQDRADEVEEALRGLSGVKVLRITRALVSDEQSDEWKKYFKVIEFERVAVVPEWIEYSGARLPVIIDPGLAFGTGQHETTAMCIRLLERYVREGMTVFDVGTGSGILGIAARRLGADAVVMNDVDAEAVNSARRNLAANGLTAQVQQDFPAGECDLLVCSITANVLLALRESITGAVKPGGTVILSGIINDRFQDVKREYEAGGLRLVTSSMDGDWSAAVFTKIS